MKNDTINETVSNRICNHMNTDHVNAVIAYAQYYGGLKDAKEATLVNISTENMLIKADGKDLLIEFDHHLIDSEDAHKTLISMLREIPKDSLEEESDDLTKNQV